MQPIRIAAAQFQPRDGDKAYNLRVMEDLIREAQKSGARAVSFHEMCITAYTFVSTLGEAEVRNLSEAVPSGPSTQALIALARKYDMYLLAGLIEQDGEKCYNTYICVGPGGFIARHRKLHVFISPYLSPGDSYTLFKIEGWTCGILICYDNNVIENVRATTLLGAQVIFAPHVTGCTPSAMPGRGYVADELWQNRVDDPVPLRMEFDGPKGRGWLMRWLPARAFDNGVYYVFSNPIGYDGAHLKNGHAMILDPYGELLTEIRSFSDGICTATLTAQKLTLAGGYRYRNARRPDLYRETLGQAHQPTLKPVWMEAEQDGEKNT